MRPDLLSTLSTVPPGLILRTHSRCGAVRAKARRSEVARTLQGRIVGCFYRIPSSECAVIYAHQRTHGGLAEPFAKPPGQHGNGQPGYGCGRKDEETGMGGQESPEQESEGDQPQRARRGSR